MTGAERRRDFPRLLRTPSPDSDRLEGPHLGVAQNDMGRQLAGAHHEQAPGIGWGKILRGQGRCSPRAAQCQFVTVQNGLRCARVGVEQYVAGVHRRQATQHVIRKDRYELPRRWRHSRAIRA